MVTGSSPFSSKTCTSQVYLSQKKHVRKPGKEVLQSITSRPPSQSPANFDLAFPPSLPSFPSSLSSRLRWRSTFSTARILEERSLNPIWVRSVLIYQKKSSRKAKKEGGRKERSSSFPSLPSFADNAAEVGFCSFFSRLPKVSMYIPVVPKSPGADAPSLYLYRCLKEPSDSLNDPFVLSSSLPPSLLPSIPSLLPTHSFSPTRHRLITLSMEPTLSSLRRSSTTPRTRSSSWEESPKHGLPVCLPSPST